MIYYTVFTDSISAVNEFAKFNYFCEDGDNEFKIKINVSDLENFRASVIYFKSNGKSKMLELMEDWCHDFVSDGEEISVGLEDKILEIFNS